MIFDPLTDAVTVSMPSSAAGMFGGGALLADGTVRLLPGVNSDFMECRLWDPAADAYVAAPELVDVPAAVQGAYAGGCVLPDGRVVFTPYYARKLVVWDAGVGGGFGSDVALSGFWNRWP